MQARKVLMAIAGMSVAAFCVGKAWAGYALKSTQTNVTSSYASGAVGGARDTADQTQFIDCYAWTSGTSTTLTCEAFDGAHYLSCTTTNSAYAALYSSITEGASIYFTANSSGACTALELGVGSQYAPKVL